MVKHRKPENVDLKDLQFCDGLRWHDNKLWFSDLLGRRVYCFDYYKNNLVQVAYIGGQPSGLGHCADGSLLVASMMDRLIVKVADGETSIYQDLSLICPTPLNDLLVDHHDRVYVGSFGFQAAYENPEKAKPSNLYLVAEDRSISIVAEGLMFPNGMAITKNGSQLIVAETFANRLTSFDISPSGHLSNRQLFCDLESRSPDGICVDGENSVWVGCPFSEEFLKISSAGEVTKVLKTEGRWAVSPAVGGRENQFLFLATADTTLHDYHDGISQADIEVMYLSTSGL